MHKLSYLNEVICTFQNILHEEWIYMCACVYKFYLSKSRKEINIPEYICAVCNSARRDASFYF